MIGVFEKYFQRERVPRDLFCLRERVTQLFVAFELAFRLVDQRVRSFRGYAERSDGEPRRREHRRGKRNANEFCLHLFPP